jgi:hypothetical protein
MTEQEVRKVLKSCGWSFLRRERRSRSYMYAARKTRGKRKEMYIAPFTKLAQLTLDQLVTKLQIVELTPVDVDSKKATPQLAANGAA